MTNLTEQLIKENKELEKRNFDLHKLISELGEENKRLKHDVGNLGYKIKNQRKEIERQIAQNTKLKELLDDCRIELYYWDDKDCELIVRINQVLADNQIQANTVACNKIQENE